MFWRENGRRQYVKCDVDRDVTPDVACDPPGLGRACACASRCQRFNVTHLHTGGGRYCITFHPCSQCK